jgi:hypothetical protein
MANSTAQTSAPTPYRVTATGVVVKRTRIIGTATVIYDAWEPTRLMDATDGHSTICSGSDCARAGWLGRVGTKRLPRELDALPANSTERLLAVRSWHAQEYDRAHAAILDAYPELGDAIGIRSMDMGEIVTRENA